MKICQYCHDCMEGGPNSSKIFHGICPGCAPILIAIGRQKLIAFVDSGNKKNKGTEDPAKVVSGGWTWPEFIKYQRELGRDVVEIV